jgi:amino-acid N-acetyltransferase
MRSSLEICRAQPGDLAAVQSLLEAAGLVTQDVDPELRDYFVAVRENEVVGAVGLEPHGTVGLLRSLVVVPRLAGRGLGRALALQQVEDAQARGFAELFLLTRTASDFFAKLGFAPIERAAVPAAIQRTAEYSTLCPATATVMMRVLEPGTEWPASDGRSRQRSR